jgi:preprotein translocase subunit SecY
MGIIVFSIAAILSLPKQFLTVYLGVILEQSSDGTTVSKKDSIIKYTVLGVTTLITIWAVWYIYAEMGKVKVQVIHTRRKARYVAAGSL